MIKEITFLTSASKERSKLRRLAKRMLGYSDRPVGSGLEIGVGRSGPEVVLMTLLDGLQKSNISTIVDPCPGDRYKDIVHVAWGIDSLQWAILEKKQRRIGTLIVSPTVVSHPLEATGLVLSPEIDCILLASSWVESMFLSSCPSLEARTAVWPCGVDTNYWSPIATGKDESLIDVLVYDKTNAPIFRDVPSSEKVSEIDVLRQMDLLSSAGHSLRRIRYGEFQRDEYRALLRRSKLMVYLSYQETQGIAISEAWACNVPTLVWDRQRWGYLGYVYDMASTAPYLSPRCGERFDSIESMAFEVQKAMGNLTNYSPRKVMLEQFSIESSTKAYLEILRKLLG